MRRELSAPEIALLREVLGARGHADLLAALDRGKLDGEEVRALGDIATEELAQRGFDGNYAPTQEGRTLEDIIDALSDA